MAANPDYKRVAEAVADNVTGYTSLVQRITRHLEDAYAAGFTAGVESLVVEPPLSDVRNDLTISFDYPHDYP